MKSFLLLQLAFFTFCLYSPFSGIEYSIHPFGIELPAYYCPKVVAKSDCKESILVNEINDEGIQLLQTKKQTLIERGNYKYTIQFIHDERGALARVYSIGGVPFNKGDEIFFMAATKHRYAYRFIEKGKISSLDGVQVHHNVLQLESPAVDWLSTAQITIVYLKDNTKNELRKFKLSEARTTGFKQLSTCFKLSFRSPD